MFKAKHFNNLIIIRTLLSANSPYILNKPKEKEYVRKSNNYLFQMAMGHPVNTFDINTRFITVEGNFGVGKAKIAKKIANYFALDYVDDIDENNLYVIPFGKIKYDMRKYNALLPQSSKIYTRELFWNDKDPIKNGKPLLLQLHHYYWRFFNCCKAMCNLFNTGKGLVMKRSPWSDNVMALAFRECGLMSPQAYKYYNLVRCESITNLWRPHFIVYVKASPKMIRQKINQNPLMKNACNLSDKLIETYQDIMENQYLDDAKRFSKVLTIDLSEYNIDDEEDFDFLMESMSKENEKFEEIDEFDKMFYDWTNGTYNKKRLSFHRRYFSYAEECFLGSFPTIVIPRSLKEGAYSEDELARIHAIAARDERVTTDASSNPKWASWKDILFPIPQFNYGSLNNQPYIMMRRAYE